MSGFTHHRHFSIGIERYRTFEHPDGLVVEQYVGSAWKAIDRNQDRKAYDEVARLWRLGR